MRNARLDDAALRRWVGLGLNALGEARDEIDGLNVYPVPDGDTGTNMFLTFEGAARALDQCPAGNLEATGTAIARGALLGARGNSGVILSQLLRGMAEGLAGETSDVSGHTVAASFTRASRLADQAVERPVEGTILTVARAAATGAGSADGDDLAAVVTAAADHAREALLRTPEQLEALRRAGVVDAGGRGLVVLLDAMTQTLTGRRPPPTAVRVEPATGAPSAERVQVYSGPAHEVMFMLASDPQRVTALRAELSGLGDSLVVVGGDPLWNVHVHVDDAGAAIEAAIRAGSPSSIRITHLTAAPASEAPSRAVVAVAHGPGIATVLADASVTVVRAQPRQRPSTAELLDGLHRAHAGEVVLLPSDKDTLQVAEAAAAEARKEGMTVSVIPSRSVVQTLAAVAVHDPIRPFHDDVVAMTRAAGATRYGAVTIAARDGMTSAGICRVGDVLGLAHGDIVEIGTDVSEVARHLIDRLCTGGSEMVTLVEGCELDEDAQAAVAAHLRSEYPALDVVTYDGGQPFWPLIIGVE